MRSEADRAFSTSSRIERPTGLVHVRVDLRADRHAVHLLHSFDHRLPVVGQGLDAGQGLFDGGGEDVDPFYLLHVVELSPDAGVFRLW